MIYFWFLVILMISQRTSETNLTNPLIRFQNFLGTDSIQVSRCDIVCSQKKDEDEECHRSCMKQPFQKRGRCPESFENLSLFVQACVYFCYEDGECPSTEKCCKHSCGQTCQPAMGLDKETHLPSIPYNLRARERKRKNGVQLFWDVGQLENPKEDQSVLFVLEERHHLGRFYNEPLLGEWMPVLSTKKHSINLKNFIKPEYWYQFRVAAVNINGTKGFSRESEGFKLTRRPKLSKPTNLKVKQINEINGTIWAVVEWAPSESTIPIHRYKVFWSHRVDDRNIPYKSETVMVQRDSVPEDQLFYQLKNLKKNTDYFIQVRAVASYGRNSIKSKPAKLIFKTSKMEDQYELDDIEMD